MMDHFELPPLPYAKNALTPFLSAETLDYHHGKHHQGYVNHLNRLLESSSLKGLELETLLKKASGAIYNNAAQHWNHSFYWQCLSPDEGLSPSPNLRRTIDQAFGSMAEFQLRFAAMAAGLFGSGWAWLTVEPARRGLRIEVTPDGENPLVWGRKPLIACDLWEHAYYLDYRNERGRYVEAFFKRINWDFAAKNFTAWETASAKEHQSAVR